MRSRRRCHRSYFSTSWGNGGRGRRSVEEGLRWETEKRSLFAAYKVDFKKRAVVTARVPFAAATAKVLLCTDPRFAQQLVLVEVADGLSRGLVTEWIRCNFLYFISCTTNVWLVALA